MNTFIQFLITGLRLGSVYALIALGYTMVYGIIKLINFAHGDFIMVGGYTLFFTIPLMMGAGLPGWLAVVFAIAVCALTGVIVELLAYRPIRKKGNSLTALITAIAMSFVLENLAQAIPFIGPDPKVPYQLFNRMVTIAGVQIGEATIITIGVSAVVMIIRYLFTQKTKTGRAMRCVSEDKEAAILMGIDVNRTITITFAIGAGLAAIAALMYLTQYPKVITTMGATLGIYAFKEPVLKTVHLGISFDGLKAVSDFNLEIYEGELVGLIGPNGAGKITVFNLLTGVYKPTERAVYLNGTSVWVFPIMTGAIILLIIVGALLYKEVITIQKIIGIIVCMFGLYLLNK